VRILFDHNLPHKLRTNLAAPGLYEIVTTSCMGWADLKNGDLLRTAEEHGFDVFVTGDKSLVDEQNLVGRRLAIVALSANNWPIVRNHISRIRAAIVSADPGSFQAVDCGIFTASSPPTSEAQQTRNLRTPQARAIMEAMPTVHMSEAEVARDLHAALAKVQQGVEIVIEQDHRPVAVLKPSQSPPPGRKLSECIALAKAWEEKLGYAPIPDPDFADDVQAGIDSRRDSFEPPAWD